MEPENPIVDPAELAREGAKKLTLLDERISKMVAAVTGAPVASVADEPRRLRILCLVTLEQNPYDGDGAIFFSETAYRPSDVPTLGAIECPLCGGKHRLISIKTALREQYQVKPAFAGILIDGSYLLADDLLPQHKNIGKQTRPVRPPVRRSPFQKRQREKFH